MNSDEAKRVLQLYRPNGRASERRFFQEALEQVKKDPVLTAWWESECAWDEAVRSKLRETRAPDDLKKSILSTCAAVYCRQPWWRKPSVLALIICVILGLLSLAWVFVFRSFFQ